MIKKMFFMLTLMLTLTSYASDTSDLTNKIVDNTSSGVEQVYNDGKELAREISDKAEIVISELAKSLKVTSQKVWQILVKQQKVLAWCYLIGLILSIFGWIHFYYRFNKMKSELDGKGRQLKSNQLIATTTFLFTLVISIISMVHFSSMMTGFINPEYGAMAHILELAKSIK